MALKADGAHNRLTWVVIIRIIPNVSVLSSLGSRAPDVFLSKQYKALFIVVLDAVVDQNVCCK